MMIKMRRVISKETIVIISTAIVALMPFIELDYLFYDTLNALGIPRLLTVVKFLLLPLLALTTFLLFETKKKKKLTLVSIFIVVFGVYFILHTKNANTLQYEMFLTNNFVFILSDEVIYMATLLLPLGYVWVFNMQDIKEKMIKIVMITISSITAFPIFLSNIFLFGESTYVGYTIDNIFSWFSLPFNETVNHPRMYATKFFFEEGNSIGILMIMVLPFLYYFLFRSKSNKEKVSLIILIFIQSLAMIMLSTRIATYGAVLIPLAMVSISLILAALKIENTNRLYIVVCGLFIIINSFVIPYGPAYQNQQIDAMDFGFIKGDEGERNQAKDHILRGGENLIPFSEEWTNFYVFMFEEYSYLIGITPPIYYNEWYDYRHDPKFWVDLITEYELEERVSGRQIQQIFTNYKYNPLSFYDKVMGMGYSTFMRGSIILEKDFNQQFYSLGYLGFSLLMLPWIIMLTYLGVKLLLGYKKGKWTYLNIVLMMSIVIGLVGANMSGHTMDEMSTSMFISLIFAVLFKSLSVKMEDNN